MDVKINIKVNMPKLKTFCELSSFFQKMFKFYFSF